MVLSSRASVSVFKSAQPEIKLTANPPPVLLGGESSYTLQRVADYCEGWFPRSRQPHLVSQGMAELKERAAKVGRDMESISVSVFGAAADPALLDGYRSTGVTRCILRLPSEGRESILPLLDQYAKLLP